MFKRVRGMSRRKQVLAAAIVTGVAATGTVALILGLSGGSRPRAAISPPPTKQPDPPSEVVGGESLKGSSGLLKTIRYGDAISVSVTAIHKVKSKGSGPGAIAGRPLTIFTVRFTNGSSQTLDLNKVRVVARYGPGHAQASPVSYGDLNDFYGTVTPGDRRTASYAFALPRTGYRNVVLKVAFDSKHKVAVFAGAVS